METYLELFKQTGLPGEVASCRVGRDPRPIFTGVAQQAYHHLPASECSSYGSLKAAILVHHSAGLWRHPTCPASGDESSSSNPKLARGREGVRDAGPTRLGQVQERHTKLDLLIALLEKHRVTTEMMRRGGTNSPGEDTEATLDSGSAITLVQPEFTEHSTGEEVDMACVHGDTQGYPTTDMQIIIPRGQCRVRAGVVSNLHVLVLMGRDYSIFYSSWREGPRREAQGESADESSPTPTPDGPPRTHSPRLGGLRSGEWGGGDWAREKCATKHH